MNARIRNGIRRACAAASASASGGDFSSKDISDAKKALRWVNSVPHGAVVVVLTKAEASALDYALGNSMDNGDDAQVMVDKRTRDAAWRGREKLKEAARK